jgi:hypothetical protein
LFKIFSYNLFYAYTVNSCTVFPWHLCIYGSKENLMRKNP